MSLWEFLMGNTRLSCVGVHLCASIYPSICINNSLEETIETDLVYYLIRCEVWARQLRTARVELALLISFIHKHIWGPLVSGAGPGAVNTATNKYFPSGVGRCPKNSYLW